MSYRVMNVKESEPIINNWIEQAVSVIESITGILVDSEDILYRLADSEWIFCGGYYENDETLIDMKSALIQLSRIVEREVKFIEDEKKGEY